MPVIAGVVTNTAGEAVPEARVMFARSPVPVPDVATLTDEGGGFALSAPATGAYELTVATDEAVTQVPVELAEGTERVEIRVVLPT